MECLVVRERLTEYALSTLPSSEQRELERHFEWCAGCRKEARELRDAGALVGLSLVPAEPRPELEDAVVERIRDVTGRASAPSRRPWVRRGVTVLAAVVGLVGVSLSGFLFAREQAFEHRAHQSQRQAQQFARELEQLLRDFSIQSTQQRAVTRAILAPAGGSSGGGGAIRVTSSHFEDIVMVFVGALPQDGAPYRVCLAGSHEPRLLVGAIRTVGSAGGSDVENEFATDLRSYRSVEVRDRTGAIVLRGSFAAET